MKATSLLKRLETFLNRYEFAQMKLDNGTILEADEFTVDGTVFIVTEDERVPLPIGEYSLEDGTSLVVAEEGVIGSIGEKVEEPKESEMEEEIIKEEEVVEMNYASKQELEEAVAEVKDMIDEVKAMIEPKENEMEEIVDEEVKEVEASGETGKSLKTRTVKEEFSEEQIELAKELAKPSAEPLKHNPDADKSVNLKKISTNRIGLSAMDRILAKISNIEK